MQRELTSDSDSKKSFYNTIEEYQNKIRYLEEHYHKNEENNKKQFIEINKLAEEFENSAKQLKISLDKVTEEYKTFKIITLN